MHMRLGHILRCVVCALTPIAGSMVAHLAAAEDQPAGLPRLPYHLTARPFETLAIEREAYLDVLEGLCGYLASLQDEHGAIIDPYLGREHQYATPYFAYPVAVLLEAGRGESLREAGVRAMEHATACLAAGSDGIPDRHGEFFIAPLTEALPLYRNHVDETTWRTWQDRLRTPLEKIIETTEGHINNWRTYAMKGQWLRCRAGLAERDDVLAFIGDAWLNRTQRARIAEDKWNLYQDWSSDPQSHAVEAVGRGNLLALVASGYDGPERDEMQRLVRRGTRASLLWQDPSGQCPPNGRTDNHVFNDVLYQLAFEVMAEDALARGDVDEAARFRRAALLSFQSTGRWHQSDGPRAGSYFVTKNQFDPGKRVGYQPASQYTNYNGAVAYHLAEAYQARRHAIAEQPAPTEVGGYVVTADARFASAVANAGGMQVVANLRGDTVAKYGTFWTPLGVVRFGRVGWDSRLGPSDGVYDAASRRGATFGPTWVERGRWVRLAERAKDYRGTLHAESIHPALLRFQILYHPVTGRGGPVFRHEFVVTPDGVLATLHASDEGPFGLTVPVVVDDGRPLEVTIEQSRIAVSYPRAVEPSGDEQNFLLLDPKAQVHAGERIQSAVGWIQPFRVTSSGPTVSVFVYPRSAGDPTADEVLQSFRLRADGFESCLARITGNLYQGRASVGGRGRQVDLDRDGTIDLKFDGVCNFLLQLQTRKPARLETDRATRAELEGRVLMLPAFSPVNVESAGQ